jgi:serine protease Do
VRRSSRCACALAAVLVASPALAAGPSAASRPVPSGDPAPTSSRADGEINRWLRARAAEQDRYLVARASPGQALWRARGASEPLPAFTPPTSLGPLIRAVRGAVVHIRTTAQDRKRSIGSGFVISPEGYVVTNDHVLEQAERVVVRLSDGREVLADIVGRDAATDVALLRLQPAGGPLPYAFLGDSDRLEVGEWVLAIGNPFGLEQSVSHGMISAKERALGLNVFDDFIQTDALINPGNSGGPLFNMKGEVVGVNAAIINQGQGIGFAVPINLVKDLLPNLRENGRLARGWLGLNIQEPAAAEPSRRALVRDVFEGSPAAKAGVREGDLILAVNGRPIESYLQLLRRVAVLGPGHEVKLSLQRTGKPLELVVKLGERPAPQAAPAVAGAQTDPMGLVLRELDAQVAASLGQPAGKGLLIAGLLPGSAGERAGLAVGDLVTEVNRRRVSTLKEYRASVNSTAAEVLLRIERAGSSRYVAVRLDAR